MPYYRKSILILCLTLLLTALAACQVGSPAPSPTPVPDGEFWYRVYFSDPGGPNSGSLRGGPDAELAAAILDAQQTVDLAVLDLNLWSIRDALIGAHDRGLAVRVVIEANYLDRSEIQDLIEAGVPVVADQNENLMHDKFVVIDGAEVWTGSMNFTLNGAYRNDNNLLRFRAVQLADNYTAEFEEMFLDKQFGPESPANTPYPMLTLDGTQLETYFSPDDGAQARLVELIESAEDRVAFLAFVLTADPVRDALLAAHQRGVEVVGVIEENQAGNTGSDYLALLAAGIDVRLDANPKNMHHKVILVDDRVVVTGSYNFSRSAAERNDENLLVIDNAELFGPYQEEFARIWALTE